jgi:hypothetical protein
MHAPQTKQYPPATAARILDAAVKAHVLSAVAPIDGSLQNAFAVC